MRAEKAQAQAQPARMEKAAPLLLERVAITGGTGMIGRTLAEDLAARGCEVVLLVNPGSRRAAALPSQPLLRVVPCDIAELATSGAHALEGQRFDALFHLAWGGTFGMVRNDCAAQARNIEFALDAVELAAELGCKVFVGAGSQAEYGRVEGKLAPDTPCFPENGYGMAKLAAGQLTRLACAQRGIRHEWARILSVYGPYDGLHTMVCSVARELLAGREPELTPAEQLWDYLYSEDAAEALRLMAERGRDGQVYCVGSGQARPLREYAEAIRDAIDPALPLGIGKREYAPLQVMHLVADIDALRADTGFSPRVSFEDGVRKTIEWLRQQPVE